MERREHYDPEDIESLLQERSFDELLEEERAFVLRHLSGPAEYEAMRTLLGKVRDHDRLRAPVEAPPELREKLLTTFRAQQRPQWNIWLNSVGQWLWPKEVSALWRPALALGSLALLIVAGIWVMDSGTGTIRKGQLAELKQKAVPAKEIPHVTDRQQPVTGEIRQPDTATSEGSQNVTARSVAETAPPPAPPMLDAVVMEESLSEATKEDVSSTRTLKDDMRRESGVVADEESEKKNLETTVSGATTVTATPSSHVVTEAELLQNVSLANASGSAATYKLKKRGKFEVAATVASPTLAATPELIGLLNTGW